MIVLGDKCIGVSLVGAMSAVLNGDIRISAIEIIIVGCNSKTREEFESICRGLEEIDYFGDQSFYATAMELWDKGKIFQPRLLDLPKPSAVLPHNIFWCDQNGNSFEMVLGERKSTGVQIDIAQFLERIPVAAI